MKFLANAALTLLLISSLYVNHGDTAVAEEKPETLQESVDELVQDCNVELDKNRRDVILLVGLTGVGKSILAEVLFGDLPALESIRNKVYLDYEIHNTKEGPGKKSTFISDTKCPRLFTVPGNHNLAIYDSPGFGDTRGTAYEIATGIPLGQIFEHASQVKLVVTVDFDSVKRNGDRDKFTNKILTQVLEFVKSNSIHDGGIFLLISKYSGNQESSDKDITNSIAEFLKGAHEHAVRSTEDPKRTSAINALFQSLLKTVNGQYTNIGFSRIIEKEGKLSKMEHLTRRTKIRNQLLDNPAFLFKPSDNRHFGCPISEGAKLKVREIQSKLGSQLKELLQGLVKKVVKKFVKSSGDHEQMSKFIQHYSLFLQDMQKLSEAESRKTVKNPEVLYKFVNHIGGIGGKMDELKNNIKLMNDYSGVDIDASSAVWKNAHNSWNEAIQRMKKDLLTEIRKAERKLVAEVDKLLTAVVQMLAIKFEPTDNHFDKFNVFLDDLQELKKEESRLSDRCLEIFEEFGKSIGEDVGHQVRELSESIRSLKLLTNVDVEQSSSTLAEVYKKWRDATESMKKDVAKLKAEAERVQANRRAALIAVGAAAIVGGVYVAAGPATQAVMLKLVSTAAVHAEGIDFAKYI